MSGIEAPPPQYLHSPQLSVVYDDICFDPTPQLPPTADRHSSSRKPTRVSLDDPPDRWVTAVGTTDDSSAHPGLIIVCLWLVVLLKLSIPYASLEENHPNYRPFAAFSNYSYGIAGLACIMQTGTAMRHSYEYHQLKKSPKNRRLTATLPHAITMLATSLSETASLWMLTRSPMWTLKYALLFAIIELVLAVASVRQAVDRRRRRLLGVWPLHERLPKKIKDYWFLEAPCSLQACYAGIVLISCFSYKEIAYPDFGNDPISNQVGTACVCLLFMSASATAATIAKKNGDCIPAAVGSYASFDIAWNLWQTPDFTRYPNLAWLNSRLSREPFSRVFGVLGSFLGLAGLVCMIIQARALRIALRASRVDADATYSFLGGRSMATSRFRSLSDFQNRVDAADDYGEGGYYDPSSAKK